MLPVSSSSTDVCRTGRDAGSGNASTHSSFTAASASGTATEKFIRAMCSRLPPAAVMIILRFSNICFVCCWTPSGSFPLAGSIPWTPLVMTNGPMRDAAGIGNCPWLKPSILMLRRLLIAALSGESTNASPRPAQSRCLCWLRACLCIIPMGSTEGPTSHTEAHADRRSHRSFGAVQTIRGRGQPAG